MQRKSLISLGEHTYGEAGLSIKEWGEGGALTIGKYCSLASGIEIFLGGAHRTDWISTYPFHLLFPEMVSEPHYTHAPVNNDVKIGNDVWIASGVTILPGVSIGDGAMIGTRSVVTKDVPDYGFVAGNPARFIRSRFTADIIEQLQILHWWDLPMAEVQQLRHILTAAPDIDALKGLVRRYRIDPPED
jgi:acetyltransferase-like isoleucine patch superfamily enzyme